MDIRLIIVILFIHWFADFVLQTDGQAKNKSKSWLSLIEHTGTYSVLWFIASIPLTVFAGTLAMMWFAPITFLCHTATDFYTSRINSKLYEDKNIHGFFVSIGFDQWLHYVQLILTWYFLSKI